MSKSTTRADLNQVNLPTKFWEFADLGFDTAKKAWFIQFVSETNQNVGSYLAPSITMTGGDAIQYEWKDNKEKVLWHVRERFFSEEFDGFVVDPAGAMTVNFKDETDQNEDLHTPKEYAYIEYAYHLTSKDGDKAPTGFVEFFNEKGEVIRRFNNRWIIVEKVFRKTAGEFPRIRLMAKKSDISEVIVSRTAIIISGRPLER